LNWNKIIELICFVGLIFCFASFASSQSEDIPSGITLQYTSDTVTIENGFSKLYKRITIPGLDNWTVPGEPVVPFRTAKILIPQGEVVQEIKVRPGSEIYLGKMLIEPAQEPVPIQDLSDRTKARTLTPPKEQVYASMEPYPNELYSVVGVQNKQGYSVLYINLYPIKYIPGTKDVYYFDKFEVTVMTEPSEKLDTDLFRGKPQDRDHIASMVDNPRDISTYVSDLTLTESSRLLEGDYDYVIITSEYLKNCAGPDNFYTLLEWKEEKGVSTAIVTVEDIYDEYNGLDNQEKIRNFIKDVYGNNGVTYILLGGDADGDDVGGESGDDIVPVRGLWAGKSECSPPNIPADLYYACLDGSYDSDGDGIYGEPTDGTCGGEVDLLAEVYVGRAPVDTCDELRNFVRKTIDYESSPCNSYLREVWMVGEYLGFGGVGDWGGNYKDEIKDGTSENGYTTVGFPDDYEKFTLYDRDYPGTDWPKSELIDIINANVHAINHLGHSNVGYTMKMVNADVDALTNEKFFFGYSQGCYGGAFDNRGSSCDYYNYDCILEHFVTEPCGAFGFIGNSRYGWGVGYSTDGASQRYDRQFWDAIFGEDIRNVGRANQDSKEDNIGFTSDKTMRFCYYEINLLGDPETPYLLPITLEHDIEVSYLDAPDYLKPGETANIQSVIRNSGLSDEVSIGVQLLDGDLILDSYTVPSLNSGSSTDVSFTWSSDLEGEYTLSVFAVPVNDEDYIENNIVNAAIKVVDAQILLIDDDDSDNYETYYEAALSANGYNYIVLERSPTFEELSSFDCVIWFTGDDSEETLTDDDPANLSQYLDAGGSLFVSGQDIGWDINDTDFYGDYLHAEYVRDSTSIDALEGVAEDPISDGLVINIDQFFPSEIAPLEGAFEVFNYQGDGCGAVRVDTGTYKVVYFAFGFEAIDSEADRNGVMGKVLEYLSCGNKPDMFSVYRRSAQAGRHKFLI